MKAEQALVVLPTYNEAGNVLAVSRGALEADPSVDVLVVDDNSPDGTAELVERSRQSEPRLHLLRRERKLGLGTAYLAGFRYGLDRGYGRVITMDCDQSHAPEALPSLLSAARHCDMVIGSRYIPGGDVVDWSLARRALSAFANAYVRVLLRMPIHDCTSGYRCYSRQVLETVEPFEIRSSGYSFLEEMAWRVHHCGFRIVEVPIVFAGRHSGTSKIDRSEIYRAAWHVLSIALRPPRLERRRR